MGRKSNNVSGMGANNTSNLQGKDK